MIDEELKKKASQDRRTLIRLASTLPAGDEMRRAILSGLQRRERRIATEQKVAASQWVGYIEDPEGGGMARFFGPSSKAGISRKMKNLPLPEFDWDRTMVNLDMTMNDLYSFLHRKPSDVWFRSLPPKEKRVLDGLLAEYKAQASAKTAGHPLGDRAVVNKETASLLKNWVKAGVRDWEKVTAKFYLNDVSKAHDQISDFEKALGRMRNGVTDLYSDYIQHSDYDEFYDELTDSGFYGLETAIEEAEHDLTQMIDRGWADDGYEDAVQEEIENTILPALEDAMDDFKREFGRPPRVASKQEE